MRRHLVLTVMRLLGVACFVFALGSCTPTGLSQPEGPSGWIDKPGWQSKRFMVATTNPLATDAGYQTLKAGGSAVDAAIVVQMVLTLTEPQSSGIGGGAFMLHYDGNTVKSFDGRETAPAEIDEALFLKTNGDPMAFLDAVTGGRSVGTPGVLRMLELAHQQYGRLPWASLFDPAIRLAENGFAMSARLHALLASETRLKNDPVALAYFYNFNGTPKAVGTLLKNPALAATLRQIARKGAGALYTGDIARDIINKVRNHPTNPGRLSQGDLVRYRAKERAPICVVYHQRYDVCGMAPPSAGAITIGEILGVLERTDIERYRPTRVGSSWRLAPEAVHLYTEAARLAYADRNVYIADADYAPVPLSLLDKNYLARRAALIGGKSLNVAEPGVPSGAKINLGQDDSREFFSTSHISIVDGQGNAVTMTTSIEDAFGARLMVRGFLLNNQLTDFSFTPTQNGKPVANRAQAGKRPRSSMAPTFVFDRTNRQLLLVIGSPGGPSIINYVAKVIIGTLDWKLGVQDAIALPNFGSRNGPTELEKGFANDELIEALKARGHNVRVVDQTSGLQGILRIPSGWSAGADPRREGTARGD